MSVLQGGNYDLPGKETTLEGSEQRADGEKSMVCARDASARDSAYQERTRRVTHSCALRPSWRP